MANKFQVKRTSVTTRTPNVTSSGNTHYIDTGELALNLTDKKMFSSNGTAYFEVGQNLADLAVSGNITLSGALSANGNVGTDGQVLTSNGTVSYWADGGGGGGGFTNGQSISVNNFVITGAFQANNSNGSADYILASNGAGGVYWKSELPLSTGNIVSYSATANGTQTVFETGFSTDQAANNLLVTIDGMLQVPTTHYTVTGANVIFTSTPVSGSLIEVRDVSVQGTAIGIGALYDTFTANGTGTTYTLSTPPTHEDQTIVSIDGVVQAKATYTTNSVSGVLTLDAAPPNNSVVDVTSFVRQGITNNALYIHNNAFTGNGTATVFTLTEGGNKEYSIVTIDGVFQHKTAYHISGTTLTFNAAPADGAAIEAQFFKGTTFSANLQLASFTNTAILFADEGTANGVSTLTFNKTTATLGVGNVAPPANDTYYIGNSTMLYLEMHANTFSGTATTAQYADLAEIYTCKEDYPVGTVMGVGRDLNYEVESCTKFITPIGVISKHPGFIMNSKADGVTVGLKGKVEIRVRGGVLKGDVVRTTSEAGVAAVNGEGEIVGVSLQSNHNKDEKLVKCLLKV